MCGNHFPKFTRALFALLAGLAAAALLVWSGGSTAIVQAQSAGSTVGIPPPDIVLEPREGSIWIQADFQAAYDSDLGLNHLHFDLRYIRSDATKLTSPTPSGRYWMPLEEPIG